MSGQPQATFAQFPFSGGQRSSEDEWLIQSPELLAAENVRVTKSGALDKRFGSTRVANASTIPGSDAPQTLATGRFTCLSYAGNLVYLNGYKLLTMPGRVSNYLEHADKVGGCTPLVTRISSIESYDLSTTNLGLTDCAEFEDASGTEYIAYAYEAYGATTVRVVEKNTRNVFRDSSNAAMTESFAGVHPRLVVAGTKLFLVTKIIATSSVTMYELLTTTMVWQAGTTVISLPEVFDAVSYTASSWLLAYWDGGQAKLSKVNTNGAITSTLVITATADTFWYAPCIHATVGGHIWLSYALEAPSGYRHYVACVDEATFAHVGASPFEVSAFGSNVAVTSAVCRYSSTACVVAFTQVDTASAYAYRTRSWMVTSAGVVTVGSTMANTAVASRMFQQSTLLYLPCFVGGAGVTLANKQYSHVLYDVRAVELATGSGSENFRPARVASPRQVFSYDETGSAAFGGEFSDRTWAPSSTIVNTNEFECVYLEYAGRSITTRNASANLVSCKDDFASTGYGAMSGGQLGKDLYFGGFSFDGVQPAEMNFLHRPESARSYTAGATGTGGLVAGSSYAYTYCYVYTTDTGEVMRSAPATASTQLVTPGNDSFTITVPVLAPTNRQSGVRLEVYRSTATALGGPFYYLGQVALTMIGTATTASYLDDDADVTIVAGRPLYTGDVGAIRAQVANVGPPTFRWMCVHKGRLWGIDPTRRTVWFSSAYIPGEQPSFHDEFTLPVDDDIVGLVSMDEVLVAFSATRIYALDGDGPSDLFPGADSDYRGFRRIASDVGCSDPRSLCLTQSGVVFRTRLGLRLLTRGGSVELFGEEIRNDLEAYTDSTACIIAPNRNELTVAVGDGTNGKEFVYDYTTKRWHSRIRTLSKTAARTSGWCALEPARYGDTSTGLYFVDTDTGYLWTEDSATYLDNGTWVTKRVQLAHYGSAGPQGSQTLTSWHLLGRRHTAFDVSIVFDYDYVGTRTDTLALTDTTMSTWANLPALQLRRTIKIASNEVVRVTITDATPTGGGAVGTGRGCEWISYGFDVKPKTQPFALPSGQQR